MVSIIIDICSLRLFKLIIMKKYYSIQLLITVVFTLIYGISVAQINVVSDSLQCNGEDFQTFNLVVDINEQLVDIAIEDLVQDILIGDNISCTNITTNTETGTEAIGYFCNPLENDFGLPSGIVFGTSTILDIASSVGYFASSTLGTGSDPDLEAISLSTINDAVIIEFDYIPYTNIMSFSYIFGSEEFPEFVGQFNDAFGFFVSGEGLEGPYANDAVNIALIPDTEDPVTINNIYPTPYFIDNQLNNGQDVIYDGYTTALEAVVEVVPFTVYHIKLAVGDAGDSSYGTGVFLKDNSFSAWPLQYYLNSVNINNAYRSNDLSAKEGSASVTIDVELPVVAKTDICYHYSILGSAENGVDYEMISDSIVIPQDSTKASIIITAIEDDMAESMEDIILVFEHLNDTINVQIEDNPTIITGIEIQKEVSFDVFPNPAKENLSVSYEQFDGSDYEIKIYNAVGRSMYQQVFSTSKSNIDLSLWPKGIYFVSIGGERTKFIKE